MSNAMGPVPKDSPLWRAWCEYQKSESYENTKRWAAHPEHSEGSLWAAFMAGRSSLATEDLELCVSEIDADANDAKLGALLEALAAHLGRDVAPAGWRAQCYEEPGSPWSLVRDDAGWFVYHDGMTVEDNGDPTGETNGKYATAAEAAAAVEALAATEGRSGESAEGES